jgi:high-affinity K+ transport system ATPase subunit B
MPQYCHDYMHCSQDIVNFTKQSDMKDTIILIMQICSLVNLVLGFATLIVGTPEKAIFYVLIAIWILILALSIK